jgi:DNA-directed RNA polymerase specialized sigma24 family protein
MIFRTYYQSLCNYAFTFVRDKDKAEEIVQGTFLSLWEKRDTIAIRTPLKSYTILEVTAGQNQAARKRPLLWGNNFLIV